MPYYYIRRGPDLSDILIGIIIFLFIGAVIALGTLYIGAFILTIFVLAGVLIGGVYAVIMYVKAFIRACKELYTVSRPTPFANLMAKWWFLIKTTAKYAFLNNFEVAGNAFNKSKNFRFLSFRKYTWLFAAISVIVVGTLMIFFLTCLQIQLILCVILLILSLIFIAICIYLLICFIYSVIMVVKNAINAFKNNNHYTAINFSSTFTYAQLKHFCLNYYGKVFDAIVKLWDMGVSLTVSNVASGRGFGLFNIYRHFLILSSVTIMPVTILTIPFYFIVSSLIFVALFIAEFVWGLIVKLKR